MNNQQASHSWSSPWQFLWSIIKPYQWWYVLILQAPVLMSLYVFANNYSLKLLVDAFSTKAAIDYQHLVLPVSLFIGAQVLLDVIWRVSNYAEWKSVPYVRQKILATAYNYVQYHCFTYFQNTPSGSIVSKLKGILDGYDNIFNNIHHEIGKCFCVVIVSVFVLLIVNTAVFVFMFAWCVLFFMVMLPMATKLNGLSTQATESKHQAIGLFSDNISNIFSVFYFAKRQTELRRANKQLAQEFVPNQIKLEKFNFQFNMVGAVLYWIMLITVFLYMIYLRKHSEISTGDFLFVMLTTITISFELWGFITTLCNFMIQIGDFKSSFSIIALPHSQIDNANAKEFSITEGQIEFQDLSFSYNQDARVFSNLNITIKAGEKIGLIGHSGAGKSTLISLLLKTFQATKGSILVDKQPIELINSDSLRRQIALIPQDIMLFHRSIGENIGYAKDNATTEEIEQAAKMANIHDYILSLPEKYHTIVGERGVKLSGGQRQRVAIARAILKNSPIIILDEATSSLDSITEQEIQQSINTILEQNNATVIAIAHRLSTIRHMDRIIVMEDGAIIEQGTFNQLINNEQGYFKKLWDSQVNGMLL